MDAGSLTPDRIALIRELVARLFTRNSAQIRRAQSVNAPCDLIDVDQLIGIVEHVQNWRCVGCGEFLDTVTTQLTYEHVHSIRYGHCPPNVLISCKACNASHRNREFTEWLRSRDLWRAVEFDKRWQEYHKLPCGVYGWRRLVDCSRQLNHRLSLLEMERRRYTGAEPG